MISSYVHRMFDLECHTSSLFSLVSLRASAFKFMIWMALVITSPVVAQAQGNHVGNGGDAVVAEFVEKARDIFRTLIKEDLSQPYRLIVLDALDRLDRIKIVSKEKLLLDDKEVDAINYPDQLLIEINRTRWLAWPDNQFRAQISLIIHEVIWVLGHNDHQYRLTDELIKFIPPRIFDPNGYFASIPVVNAIVNVVNSKGELSIFFESQNFYGRPLKYECSLNMDDFKVCEEPYVVPLSQGLTLFKVRAVSDKNAYTPEYVFDLNTKWDTQFPINHSLQIFEEGYAFNQRGSVKTSECYDAKSNEYSSCWNFFSHSPFNPGSRKLVIRETSKDDQANNITYRW